MSTTHPAEKVQTVCLVILTSIALGATLKALKFILVPFVLASFLTLTVTPLVDLQLRYLRLPRLFAVINTLVVCLAIVLVLGWVIGYSIHGLKDDAASYQERVNQVAEETLTALPLEWLGVDATNISNLQLDLNSAQEILLAAGDAILSLVSQGFLVLIFVFFLLMGGQVRTVPIGGTWGVAEAQVKRYIRNKVLISAATGILVGGILYALNVRLALTFGLFAFVLNFIPSLGSTIATLLPLPVVLFAPDASWTTVILAILLPGAVQVLLGNILEPKIMGSSLDLHPVVILMALIFWGFLWGILGAFLAVPLTAIVKICLEKFHITAPVAEVMAGRLDALRGDHAHADPASPVDLTDKVSASQMKLP
jgi:AI-2 transport protein TqsA